MEFIVELWMEVLKLVQSYDRPLVFLQVSPLDRRESLINLEN